mgnify:CR=1 FL=1
MNQETKNRIAKISKDRDWDKFHTPENLAKSIVIEASELPECFQWEDNYNLESLKEELADVLIYCQDLVHKLNLDEDQIINDKLDKNEKKYPIDKSKDNCKKNTEFE